MADRRKKPAKLSIREQAEFIEAATRLHRACCDPAIDIRGEDYRALSDLNRAICKAIEALFDREPPWASLPGVWDDFNAEVRALRESQVARRSRFGAE